MLTVDAAHRGPSEDDWARAGMPGRLAAAVLPPAGRVVVVAPHPDDEILGAGGLLAGRTGVDAVEIIAVTDGEASHPHSPTTAGSDLRRRRRGEARKALAVIGWPDAPVTFLEVPDGDVAQHVGGVEEAIAARLDPSTLCLAPWERDGHPDHDACGRAAASAARLSGALHWAYLVWAWHWADPLGADLPWEHCRRWDLGAAAVAAKRRAIDAFSSQIRPLGPDPADGAVLPEHILARFRRPWEVFVV